MTLHRWSALRAGSALIAVLAVLAVVLAPPADAAPPADDPGGPPWSVTRTDQGWQLSYRSPDPVPMRSDYPVLVVDGRRLGPARLAADGRTLTVTTRDASVQNARRVTMTWSTAYSTEASADADRQPVDLTAGWGASGQGSVLSGDPAAPGRYRVATVEYDLGDRAVVLPGPAKPRAELRGRIYRPVGATGPRPVVLFLHGQSAGCYSTTIPGGTSSEWPCPKGYRPVRSYRGYDRLATALASRGYVVTSVSADGLNLISGFDDDFGRQARSVLLLATLDLMRQGHRGTGALQALKGGLDLDRIGLMGHSRGGEGAVAALADNARRAQPYGIRSLFLIAPTAATRITAPGVSTAVVLPYCDGDVADLAGQKYLDDATVAEPKGRAFRTGVLVLGANHNGFNTEWSPGSISQTGGDDWKGSPTAVCGARHPDRLSLARQQQVGRTYLTAFFRITLGGQRQFLPLFDGSGTRAPSTRDAVIRTTYTGPTNARRTVARLDRDTGAASVAGAARLQVCAGARFVAVGPDLPYVPAPTTDRTHPACTTTVTPNQPSHWSPSAAASNAPGLAVGRLSWTGRSGRVAFALPRAGRDVSRSTAVSFRTAPSPELARTDLSVRLVDGRGRSATVAVSATGDALVRLPGRGDPLPRVQLRTVRIPLDRFVGVNRRDVRSVQILTNRTDQGSAYLSDLAFVRTAAGRASTPRLPVIDLVGRPTVTEGPQGRTSYAAVTVRLSRASRTPITVDLNSVVAEGDGSSAPGASVVVPRTTRRVSIPAGAETATLRVPVLGNDRDGDDQAGTVALTRARGALLGNNRGFFVVRDDDPSPTVTLKPARAVEGAGVIGFAARLSTPSDRSVYVTLVPANGTAVRGRDWELPDGPEEEAFLFIEITPGSTVGTGQILVVDDRVAEPTETFGVTVTEVGNGTLTGPERVAGTITDDD